MTNKSVRDKLAEIQKNKKESDLFPVLKQLFIKKQYNDVEITHGKDEYGKDLVFNEYDEKLNIKNWYAIVVKNKNTEMKDFESQGEITRQIQLSFEYPYLDNNGNNQYINKVIVIANGSISPQAKNIIQNVLPPHQRNNVIIWGYQEIENEICKHIKELFLSGETGSEAEFIVSTYKRNMINKLSSLDNALELFNGFNISEVNDIFVNVRTANQKYENEKKRYQEYDRFHIKEEIDDSIAIINSNKNIIIKGIATSGKTLLLKRIGINSLSKYSNIGIFWFRFRDIDIETFNLSEETQKQFYQLAGNNFLKDNYFDKILLLFDAIDEIPDKDRQSIILQIDNFLNSSNNSTKYRIIITGRNIDLFENNELLKTYEEYELLPFDIGQAFKLVKKIIPDNKDKNNQFIAAIKNQQLSNSLTRTPMALTLMAIMYKDDAIDLKELPANITELYSKFSDYYLEKWDASKGLSAQYKYEECKHIMGFIAEHMHKNNLYEISATDLFSFLSVLKKKHSFDELDNVKEYIEKTKKRNTLLCYDEKNDSFSFNNISFQEYFSSIYYDDSTEDFLLDNIYNDWWQNVVVFYNGKNPKRNVFIEKIIKTSIPIDLRSKFNHMQILSKCMQAAHLISNDTEKCGIENIIYTFDSFYKTLITISDTNKSIAYFWTTLDVILQCRNLFIQLFSSKHINSNIFSDVALEILLNSNTAKYSDVTLYCLAYHLTYITKEASVFNEFLKTPNLNTRWDRIIQRDIDYLKLKNQLPVKVYNRIKRKQAHNSLYIDKQFKEAAILHLTDGSKLEQ